VDGSLHKAKEVGRPLQPTEGGVPVPVSGCSCAAVLLCFLVL